MRRWFVVVLAGLIIAPFVPSPAQAAVSSGFAYVWANQPTAAAYDAPTPYSYNSTGAVNRIVRISTGRYDVELPNLGTSGGVSQAMAYGSTTNTCQVAYNTWGADLMRVRVHCFSGGVAADTMFTAAFTNSPITPDTAYLHANEPESATYTPNPVFQHNTAGGLATIDRLGVGYYRVNVPAVTGAGDVQITGYGSSAVRCSVRSWASLGYPTFGRAIFVQCVNAADAPKDSMFTLISTGTGGFLGRTPAASARIDPPAPLTRTTPYNATISYNSGGGTITATRIGLGRYRVALPGQPLTGGTVHVTGYSFGSERCNAEYWSTTGVVVQCWQGTAPYDAPFTLAFQS